MKTHLSNISEKILQIQQSIFANNHEQLAEKTLQLIEYTLQKSDVFSLIQIQQLNLIFGELLDSMEKGDYLLTADILEYKFYKFIKVCLLEER